MGAELLAQGTNIWRESGDWVALYNIASRGSTHISCSANYHTKKYKSTINYGKGKGICSKKIKLASWIFEEKN